MTKGKAPQSGSGDAKKEGVEKPRLNFSPRFYSSGDLNTQAVAELLGQPSCMMNRSITSLRDEN